MKLNLKNDNKYSTHKIDDVKSFISNAYDKIKSRRSSDSQEEESKIKKGIANKIINPVEVSESIFVNSTNKLLLKKYSNSCSSFSLSSHDMSSHNECSDSGYTKSVTNSNSSDSLSNSQQQQQLQPQSSVNKNDNGSSRLERPTCDKKEQKVIERLKLTVEFSEERRKLLLGKFTEAQELLQV